LSDLSLWDSDLLRNRRGNNEEKIFTDEEIRMENECDQERYLELYKDIEKETLQQGKRQIYQYINVVFYVFLEEELKRFNADKNTYKQVGFSYENSNNSKESSTKATEGKYDRKNLSLCRFS
jgi:hypothetical protein